MPDPSDTPIEELVEDLTPEEQEQVIKDLEKEAWERGDIVGGQNEVEKFDEQGITPEEYGL